MQKLEAHIEKIYHGKLLDGTSRSKSVTATMGSQIDVTADIRTGSHLGKRRFEVYLHCKPTVVPAMMRRG
jgi:hypothetical protein